MAVSILEKLIKKHNCSVAKAFAKTVSEAIFHELSNMNKLEGDKLLRFCDMLEVDKSIEIYFNKFNMLITSESDFEEIRPAINPSKIVGQVIVKETNTYFIIYQYYQDHLINSLLNDEED